MFNLDVTQKCLIAECWIPTADIEAIQLALRRGTEKSGSTVAPILNQMNTKEMPPTFFRTNKYTGAFQVSIGDRTDGFCLRLHCTMAHWARCDVICSEKLIREGDYIGKTLTLNHYLDVLRS